MKKPQVARQIQSTYNTVKSQCTNRLTGQYVMFAERVSSKSTWQPRLYNRWPAPSFTYLVYIGQASLA